MGLHPPHTLPRSILFPCTPLMRPHVFGWLLCPSLPGGQLRPCCFLFQLFFIAQFDGLNNGQTLPPTHSAPVASLLKSPPHHWHCLLVGCCVKWLNDSHLRPTPPLSLYFLMRVVLLPQTREPAATIVNPALFACNGPIGSNGAMTWGRRCPIHGERTKPMDRSAAAACFDCCVLCLCLWLCFVCGSNF